MNKADARGTGDNPDGRPRNTLFNPNADNDADAEALLVGLNEEQRNAVTSEANPLAIHAGAGTGKTRVLTRRIAWRVMTQREEPSRILALTFTRKAAAELRSRLSRLGLRDQVAAGTFHSVAYAQLRTWWSDNERPEPELLGSRRRLITPKLPRDHRTTTVNDLIAEIGWAKARRIRPSAYAELAEEGGRNPPLPTPTVARIYAEYEEEKNQKNLVDFDDLLDLCRHALSTDKRFANAQRWRFRHFYVDEFQDVNPLQFDLLAGWLDGRPDLCAVGDPCQAIYSWNGADADHLIRFGDHFPGSTVLEMHQNYRSTPQILRVAASALPGRDPLMANRAAGPRPVIEKHPDEQAEAIAIAQRARTARGPNGRWQDQAILVRTNAQTEPIVAALRKTGIPVYIREGSGLLDRSDTGKELDALHLSDLSLSDWLADLKIDGFKSSQDGNELTNFDTEQGAALAELARLANEYLALGASNAGRAFVDWIRSEDSAMRDKSIDAVELATFHSAKGLEWPIVHLAGLEDGLVPISHAKGVEAHSEERRLLYVALTRAREHLFCTWAEKRTFGTKTSSRQPSPWIADLETAIAGLDRPVERSEGVHQAGELARRFRQPKPAVPAVVIALREFRSAASRAAKVPAYAVFTDATLADLVTAWPNDIKELMGVHGIGPIRADRYGSGILAVLAAHEPHE